MSTALTLGVEQRIAMLFRPEDVKRVSLLLSDQCPELPERIHVAVLKLSRGDLTVLQQQIDLAKIDWRDVLVSAGFAEDINAHRSWWPDGARTD